MTDKEIQDPNIEQGLSNSNNKKEFTEKLWSFCPVCGKKIPIIKKLKYCINCGTDLNYIKEHKKIKQKLISEPYIVPKNETQTYENSISEEYLKISDDDITKTKNHELWGTMPSIGISFGAFLLVNFVTAGILVILVFLSFNMEDLLELVANPYFLIFSLFFELIFVIIPVLYVGKYLEKPSLKNRFGLLGFSIKGFSRKGVIKEILIGLGLALGGYLLVYGVSFLTEIILEFFFGVEILNDLNNSGSDVGIIVPRGDILSLILLSLVMILIIGTSEEILFRGFMQKGLMRSLGTVGGIMITSFVFAIIHVLGIVLLFLEQSLLHILVAFLLSFPPYLIVSLFLGLIYYWRNENLIAVIIAHGVYNALTIILTYLFLYTF
jgi:membrane protease YdiL (CAAX protease family)